MGGNIELSVGQALHIQPIYFQNAGAMTSSLLARLLKIKPQFPRTPPNKTPHLTTNPISKDYLSSSLTFNLVFLLSSSPNVSGFLDEKFVS